MIKNITMTFDFDSETETVSNVKVVGSVEKVKRTTKKKSEIIEELENEAKISLEPTKLVFNNKAVADMGIAYEDRVIIEWIKEGKKLIPIIRKDEEVGNKVTKSNTIGYKGKQNTILAEFGTEFTIFPTDKEGEWKLVSLTGAPTSTTLEESIKLAEDTEADLITDTDDSIEIDDMTFSL